MSFAQTFPFRSHPFRSRAADQPPATAPSVACPAVEPAAGPAPAPAPASDGIARELVLDASGRPSRAVLLAAIMIRRGRSIEEISTATGLPPGVVACLTRTGSPAT